MFREKKKEKSVSIQERSDTTPTRILIGDKSIPDIEQITTPDTAHNKIYLELGNTLAREISENTDIEVKTVLFAEYIPGGQTSFIWKIKFGGISDSGQKLSKNFLLKMAPIGISVNKNVTDSTCINSIIVEKEAYKRITSYIKDNPEHYGSVPPQAPPGRVTTADESVSAHYLIMRYLENYRTLGEVLDDIRDPKDPMFRELLQRYMDREEINSEVSMADADPNLYNFMLSEDPSEPLTSIDMGGMFVYDENEELLHSPGAVSFTARLLDLRLTMHEGRIEGGEMISRMIRTMILFLEVLKMGLKDNVSTQGVLLDLHANELIKELSRLTLYPRSFSGYDRATLIEDKTEEIVSFLSNHMVKGVDIKLLVAGLVDIFESIKKDYDIKKTARRKGIKTDEEANNFNEAYNKFLNTIDNIF